MRRLAACTVVAIAVGSCTAPEMDTGSIVHHNKAIIDLRHKPSREDLGFEPGRNDRSYQRAAGIPAIVTTVELPTGSVSIPAFVLTADAGDFTPDTALPPRHIVVQRVFDTADQTSRSLIADAPALGFTRQDIETLLARVAIGAQDPQQGVLDGLVRDWLAVNAEVIGYPDHTVGVNYTFTIEEFHNPAVDAVVRDGVFDLDLTHRPSRRELAFLDGLDIARILPAWNDTLSVRLHLPGGVITRPVTAVTSTASQTEISLTPGSITDAQQLLAMDGPVLGVSPGAAELLAGTPGHITTTVPGRSTTFYGTTVSIDATVGQAGSFAAAVAYRFNYR